MDNVGGVSTDVTEQPSEVIVRDAKEEEREDEGDDDTRPASCFMTFIRLDVVALGAVPERWRLRE